MHSFITSLSFGFGLSILLFNALSGTNALPNLSNTEDAALGHGANLGNVAHHHSGRRHTGLGARSLAARSSSTLTNGTKAESQGLLYPGRRGDGAHFTFFDTGLGACGQFNSPADFVVALSVQVWEDGKHCFQPVTITINGKTVVATIVDKCMGCDPNQLDFTTGLFSQWAAAGPGGGTLQGSWVYGNNAPAPSPSPSPSPSPTPSSSSTQSSSVISSSASSSAPASTSSGASSASPSTALEYDSGNLQQVYIGFMAIGAAIEGTRVV